MVTAISVDLNADVGEGLNNESELMPYLSSCNIACGGHAGDIPTMTEVVKLAKKYNVSIGAHPSFPDKANFGRRNIEIKPNRLYESLKEQLLALNTVAAREEIKISHVKPHGALYNLVAKDRTTALIVLDVIESIDPLLKLYAPDNSVIANLASQKDITVIYEAFADRNYNDDLSLVSRQFDNALLTDKNEILNHILRIIKYQKVKTINGVEAPIKASTFCVHGDTKNAVEILKFLNRELPNNQIKIK